MSATFLADEFLHDLSEAVRARTQGAFGDLEWALEAQRAAVYYASLQEVTIKKLGNLGDDPRVMAGVVAARLIPHPRHPLEKPVLFIAVGSCHRDPVEWLRIFNEAKKDLSRNLGHVRLDVAAPPSIVPLDRGRDENYILRTVLAQPLFR
jgi:hypothetical protein